MDFMKTTFSKNEGASPPGEQPCGKKDEKSEESVASKADVNNQIKCKLLTFSFCFIWPREEGPVWYDDMIGTNSIVDDDILKIIQFANQVITQFI